MAKPDTWRPSDRDVLGVSLFRVPLDYRFLALLRSWWFVSAAAGVAVALVLWPNDPSDTGPPRGRHRA
jgi:hypothetical protein